MKLLLIILSVIRSPYMEEIVNNDPEIIFMFSKLNIPMFCSLDIKSQKDV
jgi:hypothetical protein